MVVGALAVALVSLQAVLALGASAATTYAFPGVFASDVTSGEMYLATSLGNGEYDEPLSATIDGSRRFSLPISSDDAAVGQWALKVHDLNGNSAYSGFLKRVSGDTFSVVPALADATLFTISGDESIPDLTIQGIAAPAPVTPPATPAPTPTTPTTSTPPSSNDDDPADYTVFGVSSWTWKKAEGSPGVVTAHGIYSYTAKGTFTITYYQCNGVAAASHTVAAPASGGKFGLTLSVPAKYFSASANTVQVVHAIAGYGTSVKSNSYGHCAKPGSSSTGSSSNTEAVPTKFIAHWSARSGPAKVGKRVKVSATTLSEAGKSHHARVSYAWKVGGKVVGHKKTLKVRKAWKHKHLTMTVTVGAMGYSSLVKNIQFGNIR